MLRHDDPLLVRAAGGMEPIARQSWKRLPLKEKKKWGERAIIQLRREHQDREAKVQSIDDFLDAADGHGAAPDIFDSDRRWPSAGVTDALAPRLSSAVACPDLRVRASWNHRAAVTQPRVARTPEQLRRSA